MWNWAGSRIKVLGVKRLPFYFLISLIALAFSVAQENRAQNAKSSGWVLRFDGIGPVSIGMTLDQVNAALGEHFSPPTSKEEEACFYLEPKHHPDTAIMVLDGRVARVDVLAQEGTVSTTPTESGIRIGDSEEKVKKVYGRKVEVSQHHYTEGHYLTVANGKDGLRFETDEGKVNAFYAGTASAIELVEGCQ